MEIDSFSSSFHEKYANKLQDTWAAVESALEDYGIACDLNLAERCVTVSKTARCKGRNYFIKAMRLVEVLTTTHVPPHMAIETLNGDRIMILIKIGNQEGGLCSEYRISKETFIKRWEYLACSLEAIAARTNCNLFLNENNLAATGTFPVMVRTAVVDFIINGKHPETSIKELLGEPFHIRAKKYGGIELQQPNIDAIGMEKCGPFLDLFGMPEVTSYSSAIIVGREKEVEEAWPFVHWFLEGYGISSTLNTVDRCLTISTTKRTMHPDLVDQAAPILELLARTSIPATKAAEILNGRLQYEIIRTGFHDRGLCAKFEIEKELDKNRDRLKCNSQLRGF
ncbi:uncharacterized protein LOC126791622 isoform X2 [Argentina anserina]|uniref:uncharacterized protein LOC126791622 isoform X2 n=1 Tax=Argentina anserina TaxID=57926 RepID=UPI00217657B3|nr:uncharacterized protein LOC126791622 isoform X2 [Potentilla anserina]